MAFRHPKTLALAAWIGAIGFILISQFALGLLPCAMCIAQRYAVLLGLTLGLLAWKSARLFWAVEFLCSGFGAYVAANQLLKTIMGGFTCSFDWYSSIDQVPWSSLWPDFFEIQTGCGDSQGSGFIGLLGHWYPALSLAFFVGIGLYCYFFLKQSISQK